MNSTTHTFTPDEYDVLDRAVVRRIHSDMTYLTSRTEAELRIREDEIEREEIERLIREGVLKPST